MQYKTPALQDWRSAQHGFVPLFLLAGLLQFGWAVVSQAAEPSPATGRAENVILITLDGLRCEEMFGGMDTRLAIDELGVRDPTPLHERYLRETREERREALLPNLWNHLQVGGWIAGDLQRDSQVRVTNEKYFSYPGYNEILCGYPDAAVDSNDKNYNANVTVLEWLNQQPSLKGRVQAYCSWDVFPYIINDRRSGVSVNAGWTPLSAGAPERIESLNFAAEHLFREWENVRYDAFTAAGAIEQMRATAPRVLYVSLGETDDWAHAGRYDRYLNAAYHNDALIEALWTKAQSIDQYQGRTAFVITTDHGRGDGREGWKSHSASLPGSEFIWIAAFGAGVKASGIDQGGRYEQAQVAATVADLLGHDYAASDDRIAPPLWSD